MRHRRRVEAARTPDEYVPPEPQGPDVPPAAPRPGETEAEVAVHAAQATGQDPWGEPEDRPDHGDNAVFEQQEVGPGPAAAVQRSARTPRDAGWSGILAGMFFVLRRLIRLCVGAFHRWQQKRAAQKPPSGTP